MKEITAATRYIKLSQVTEGQTLINKGKLIEIRPGKFGDTMIFEEQETGEEVGLGAGGQLKYLLGKGAIKMGTSYQIVFKGKKALSGGRTANDFKVFAHDTESNDVDFEDSDEELTF